MKTYKAKSGQIMVRIQVEFRISKYDIEVAIADMLAYDQMPKNKYQVMENLRKKLGYGGGDWVDYYWEKNGEENQKMAERFGRHFFPELYVVEEPKAEDVVSH